MSKREVVSVPFRTEAKDEDDVLKDGLRADGRGAEEARPVFMQAGVNKQASGSAYVEFDDTKVLAAVQGPMQSDRRLPGRSQDGVLKCDLRFATFATPQRSKFSQSAEEREMSAALQTALSSAVCLDCIPRAVVHVNALVVDAGGSDLAVCICAASLALADAGIPMLDLLSSCTVGDLAGVAQSRVEGQLLLDATRNESCRADGSLLLSMMPLRQEVVQMEAVGEWPPSQLTLCLELGMGGCLQLDRIARDTLRTGYSAAASTQ